MNQMIYPYRLSQRSRWWRASRHGGQQTDHNPGYEPQPDRPQEKDADEEAKEKAEKHAEKDDGGHGGTGKPDTHGYTSGVRRDRDATVGQLLSNRKRLATSEMRTLLETQPQTDEPQENEEAGGGNGGGVADAAAAVGEDAGGDPEVMMLYDAITGQESPMTMEWWGALCEAAEIRTAPPIQPPSPVLLANPNEPQENEEASH